MDISGAYFQPRTTLSGFLIPDVVVSEVHNDTLQVASHPVEFGPNISDHAWRMPSEVIINCFFRAGGSLSDSVNTTLFDLSLGLSPAQIYQQLLDLQANAEPFSVITRRRSYTNMLLKQIQVTTQSHNENVLSCTLTLEEVLMTATEALPTAAKDEMFDGVITASVGNKGEKVVITPVGGIGYIVPVDTTAKK